MKLPVTSNTQHIVLLMSWLAVIAQALDRQRLVLLAEIAFPATTAGSTAVSVNQNEKAQYRVHKATW